MTAQLIQLSAAAAPVPPESGSIIPALQMVLSIVGICVSVGVTVAMIVNSRSQAKTREMVDKLNKSEDDRTTERNRAEDQRRADLAQIKSESAQQLRELAAEKHDLTVKLLDERDRRMSHSLNNHAQAVTSAMKLVQDHVRTSDTRFRELAEVSPKLQVELMRVLNEAREFVRTSSASRDDFDKFCVDSKAERRVINESITQLERKVVTAEDLKKVIRELKEER